MRNYKDKENNTAIGLYSTADTIYQTLDNQLKRVEQNSNTGEIGLEDLEQGPFYMRRLQHQYLLQSLIMDLLESAIYTLDGLSRELDAPVDIISDLFFKRYCDPSYSLAMGIICLHRETFPELYEQLKEHNQSAA